MAALPPSGSTTARLSGENRLASAGSGAPLAARALDELRRSTYPELWHVACEYREGILTLRGRVSSFYMKQIAQAIVQRLEGVERVVNRVEVLRTFCPR
jgi:osmotically-inducible protein OsmY